MSASKLEDTNKNLVYIHAYLNRTKSDLLINGYIKRIENVMNIIIPQPIIALFISFYYYTLPPHRFDSKCIADEKNQIFSCQRHQTFVTFNTPWSKGKHELIFKCIKNTRSGFAIGLITNYNADPRFEWIFDNSEAGITYQIYSTRYPYSCSNPGIYCFEFGKKTFFEHIDKRINNGMIMAVRVDLDEYSIKFYFDDEQQGKTINLKKDQIYYPAIAYGSVDHESQYQLILCD